jgi:hypothetical protein
MRANHDILSQPNLNIASPTSENTLPNDKALFSRLGNLFIFLSRNTRTF